MAADVLASWGARASAAMILTKLNRDNSAPERWGLSSRSPEAGTWKLTRRFYSTAAKVPAKFQSDRTTLNTYLVIFICHEVWYYCSVITSPPQYYIGPNCIEL